MKMKYKSLKILLTELRKKRNNKIKKDFKLWLKI